MTIKLVLAGVAVMTTAAVASAQEFKDLKPSPPLALAGQGSFFIDGTTQFIDSRYISPPRSRATPETR